MVSSTPMCTGEVVRVQLSTAGKGNVHKRSVKGVWYGERQVGSTLAAEAQAISATCAASQRRPELASISVEG